MRSPFVNVGLAISAAILLLACQGCREKTPPPTSTTGNPTTGSTSQSGMPDSGDTGTPAETVMRFAAHGADWGLEFAYHNDEEAGRYAIVESLGGGVALSDFDHDGRLDIFAAGGGRYSGETELTGVTPALYRSQRAGAFTNVTIPAHATAAPCYSHAAEAADYDNDGFTDVLITGYGGLVLLHNLGDGTFAERAAEARLDDTLWSSSAAWFDLNLDGALDLYVAHYVNWSFTNNPPCDAGSGQKEVCPPRRFEPLPDTLYVGNGDGAFTDDTAAAGLRSDGKGLGVVTADVDLDGDQDVYVGNDTVPNFLYRNRGDGTLEDASLLSGTSLSDEGTPDGSMGVDVGDFDLDGKPDIWVANYERESFALYRNLGDCFFRHVSRPTGIMAAAGLYVGWGTVLSDFDHDGDEDIFASNGHVIRHPTNAPLQQKPLLFQNDAGRRFVNVAAAAGPYLTEPHMGRGAARGDIDNDGDTDLALLPTNEPLTVLENTSAGGHWLQVRLIGRHASRDAVGAVVTLTALSGPRQLRQIKGGGSYASTSDRRLNFGLGADGSPVQLTINWPGGEEQQLSDVIVDQELVVIEPPQ